MQKLHFHLFKTQTLLGEMLACQAFVKPPLTNAVVAQSCPTSNDLSGLQECWDLAFLLAGDQTTGAVNRQTPLGHQVYPGAAVGAPAADVHVDRQLWESVPHAGSLTCASSVRSQLCPAEPIRQQQAPNRAWTKSTSGRLFCAKHPNQKPTRM